jgi:Zn-dependent protease with chaperone function
VPNAGTKQSFNFLPPWLWLWLVGVALYLPEAISETRTLLNSLYMDARNLGESGYPVSGIQHQDPLRWFRYLPDLIATTIVLVGILTVLVPHARAAYLQRRFRMEDTATSLAIKEIGDFVHENAPGIRIKSNLLRTDQLAFVYPLGYRSTGLAVFGGLVRLWRSDRKAAEATVLHEIAHYRNGDVLIVGAGSPFSAFVRYSVPLLCLTGLLAHFPVYTFFSEGLEYSKATLTTAVTGGIWQLLDIPLLLVTTLAIPVVGIWCAEFSADRAAAVAQGSPDALERVLMALHHPKSRWRWLIFRLSHPPDKVRRWLVQHRNELMGATLLLLLFPITTAVQAFLNGVFRDMTVLNPLLIVVPPIVELFGGDAGEIPYHTEWDVFASYLQQRLDARVPYWLAMAILLPLWPVAVRYGRWLLHRRRQTTTPFRPGAYKAPLLSAAIMLGLLGLYSGVARYEPPPQEWLPAGDYTLNHFNPALSISIDNGWYISTKSQMYDLAQVAPEVPAHHVIWIQNVHTVYTPTYAPSLVAANMEAGPMRDTRFHDAAPRDMIGWFKEHPYLRITHSSPIVVGSAHGEEFDASISDLYRLETGGEAVCLPLFYYGVTGDNAPFGLCNKGRVRLIVVDTGGETVVIVIAGDELNEFLPEAKHVLDSVRWGE